MNRRAALVAALAVGLILEKEKARIVLCTKGKLTGEERAKRLEELRTRLAQRDQLSPEAKAKIEAAIQEAINRARAGN